MSTSRPPFLERASLRWGWAFFGLLAAVRIWMVQDLQLAAFSTARIDDRLFVDLADHLLRGDWLGPYGKTTLIKPPFYSMWIAAISVLGVPLLLAQDLLYVGACALLGRALEPVVSATVRLAVAGALLFNPMSFTQQLSMRVLREGIYASECLLVAACAIAILLRIEGSVRILASWSVGLGLALGAVWLTREEGVWLIPLLVPVLGLAVARAWRLPRRGARIVLAVLLPVASTVAAYATVRSLNERHYGVASVVELKDSSFAEAYGSLTRVRDPQRRSEVPVSRAMRERIYAASPAFRDLRDDLEGAIGQRWTDVSCREFRICDDMAGGWFHWALRDAAEADGHFASAVTAHAFFERLAREVDAACDGGSLDCDGPHDSMRPRVSPALLGPWWATLVETIEFQLRLGRFDLAQLPSAADPEGRELFERITHERTAPESGGGIDRVQGWAWAPRGARILAVDAKGRNASRASRREESPELVMALRGVGRRPGPGARRARFTLTYRCVVGPCRLRVYDGPEILAELPLDDRLHTVVRDDLLVRLEPATEELEPDAALPVFRKGILWKFRGAWAKLLGPLTVAGLLGWIVATASVVRFRRELRLWTVLSGLLACVLARSALVALLGVTTISPLNARYLSPSFPQLIAFGLLGSILLGVRVNEGVRRRLRGDRSVGVAE